MAELDYYIFSDLFSVYLTLCILMYFPIQIDTLSMRMPIVHFKGSQVDFSKSSCLILLSLKVVLISANSVDPDEMRH